MTDKERLNEIKLKFNNTIDIMLYVPYEDIKFLIEQAEKREYWMKQHRKRANELEDAYFKTQLIEKQLQQAQAKAERYKQALKFYADEENYCVTFKDYYEPILEDNGKIAREALKGETK